MEDMEKLEEGDREMLKNLHLQFTGEPGRPRSWEELPEGDKELIRRLYRQRVEGKTGGG